ncbi:unnamed protein product [Dibothriocephalus latus]|uniref:Fibronectin type-III domain-containing protein n=1 Tax=Dibothriocephalus latus TaxID=60516 RepID=A0A3P7KV07_DIBLA|nr:unnamed protein product [Dibothriocephalus latus]
MILASSHLRLLYAFGLLLLWPVHSALATTLLQPDITWPDVRDLEVIPDPTLFVALRVQWRTQPRDSLRYFEVTVRCTDSDRNDTKSSTTEAKVEYSFNLCRTTYVVEAFLQTAFNEKGMRVARTMSASGSPNAVQPPTNAKATLFVNPDRTVSLNISFVPPPLGSAPTSGVAVENITLIITSETNSSSEICRKVLKRNESFGDANQNAGMMQVGLPPVFKLGEIYKLTMYTNDVKEKSSEAKITMPTFEPRSIASAKIKSILATTIDFEWGEPIFPIDGLQGFLLRGINSSGEATVNMQSNARMGSLSNLKPYTNYSTSITPTYSDGSNSKLTKDLGFVLTWSAAPSPPTLTSVTVSGPESIVLSWKAPETTNGILEEYDAQCYRPGSDWPSGSRRVNAQTLSTEVTRLVPNTLYECAVIASTQQISWGQGGGKTSSARSSPIGTWPGSTRYCFVTVTYHPPKTQRH